MSERGGTAAGAAVTTVRRTATICNRRGLHARAAARFVKLAFEFDAEVTVAKNGTEVSGRSIMGLMMLAGGARHRDRVARHWARCRPAVDCARGTDRGGFDEA